MSPYERTRTGQRLRDLAIELDNVEVMLNWFSIQADFLNGVREKLNSLALAVETEKVGE